MKTVKLSPSDELFHKATHKSIVSWTDLAAAAPAASADIQLFPNNGTCPAGTRITNTSMKLITGFDFSDGTMNSLTMSVGTPGAVTKFLPATEVAIDGTEVIYSAALPTGQPFDLVAPDLLMARFTGAGGALPKPNLATTGEVHIYYSITSPSDAMTPIRGPL